MIDLKKIKEHCEKHNDYCEKDEKICLFYQCEHSCSILQETVIDWDMEEIEKIYNELFTQKNK